MFNEENANEEVCPDKLMRESSISFFQTSQAACMTANNFFRASSRHYDSDGGGSSASDLISNTRDVLAGSLAILRKK